MASMAPSGASLGSTGALGAGAALGGVVDRRGPARGAVADTSARQPAVVLTLAVAALTLPSALLAFSNRLEAIPATHDQAGPLANHASGDGDSSLGSFIKGLTGGGPLFRFTPAGLAARPDRSVTVAVRVDDSANAIIVRALPRSAPRQANAPALHIAPTAYNLDLARGASALSAAPATAFNLHADSKALGIMPDIDHLDADEAPHGPSRLTPHISLDERDRAGRLPRSLEGAGEQIVNVGGSYRLTRNIDVTASLRYSQDRDRLKALAENKTDDQAVFLGTQFHF